MPVNAIGVLLCTGRPKPAFDAAQPDADGHQPLLRTVVQVSLDPPTLLVGRLGNARP